jgi:hypothetical protein
LITGFGLDLIVPQDAYKNMDTLRSWLEANIFVGLLRQSDIYALTISCSPESMVSR